MLRRCLSVICMIALVAATSAPSLAAGFDAYLGAPNHGLDSYRRAGELTSGVYLRIPFSSTPRRSLSETRFGLTLGARTQGQYRYGGRAAPRYTAKRLDLSIGLGGKETVRLNGLSLADMTALYAGEDDKGKKKRKAWHWVLGGALALIGGIVLLAVSVCAVDKCKEDDIVCC